MNPLIWRAALCYAISTRNAVAVIGLLLIDLQQRFAFNFNVLMRKCDAVDIETALLKPLAILVCRLGAGLIPDEQTLWKLLYGIQRQVATDLTTKANRRTNPPIDRRIHRQKSSSQASQFLFSFAKADLNEKPSSWLSPIEQLEQQEELLALCRELQTMPQLPLAVLREVRRFELERGSSHGAFQAVALLAECSEEGVVIAIRSPDPETPTRLKPAKSVVRQIRKLYHEAVDYLG